VTRRRFSRACAVLAALVLSGCAALRPPPAPTPGTDDPRWLARQQALAALDTFTLSGRVAIQRGSEGGGAKLRWRQAGDSTDLRIMAPMAQGTFRLQGDSTGVALTAPDGRQYAAENFEDLMATHLDWSLPVDGARYWVRGIPDPAERIEHIGFDGAGRLSDLAQAGWRISVLEYRDVDGKSLPARLFLNAGDLKIRLAIDTWTFAPI
jgi:outer membrane lipoprotein LolB